MEIHPDVARRLRKAPVTAALDLQLDRDKEGEKEPFAVRTDTGGEGRLGRVLQCEWAENRRPSRGNWRPLSASWRGYAARLALLHHVVGRVGDMSDSDPIEPVSIEAGVVLVRWFAYETHASTEPG